MDKPIIFLASQDRAVLGALERDLDRRFGNDCRILGAHAARAGLSMLEALAEVGEAVALIVADDALNGDADGPVDGVAFLADWAAPREPGFAMFRLVDAETSPRGHEIRELLTRLNAPHTCHTPESTEGGRLLAEARGHDGRLPVVLRHDGRVMVDPRDAELIEAIGGATRLGSDVHDVVIVAASALFVLIGGVPHTRWLDGVVARDQNGYLMTGPDLTVNGATPGDWPLDRPPYLLETSVPGVFASGDVRCRSIKRVASAVGEGAAAIQLVHQHLEELRAASPAAVA